jgi:hypothetical protein
VRVDADYKSKQEVCIRVVAFSSLTLLSNCIAKEFVRRKREERKRKKLEMLTQMLTPRKGESPNHLPSPQGMPNQQYYATHLADMQHQQQQPHVDYMQQQQHPQLATHYAVPPAGGYPVQSQYFHSNPPLNGYQGSAPVMTRADYDGQGGAHRAASSWPAAVPPLPAGVPAPVMTTTTAMPSLMVSTSTNGIAFVGDGVSDHSSANLSLDNGFSLIPPRAHSQDHAAKLHISTVAPTATPKFPPTPLGSQIHVSIPGHSHFDVLSPPPVLVPGMAGKDNVSGNNILIGGVSMQPSVPSTPTAATVVSASNNFLQFQNGL